MNNQNLQFIREELMIATADLSGRSKGQLVALSESGLVNTNRHKRKHRTMLDDVTGKVITIYSDPVPGIQTRGKGTSKVLIEPIQFCTASWRRALSTIETHEHSWLSWCYADNLLFDHQVAITEWGWNEFKANLGKQKVAGKTLLRLQALVWLAAQDVKNELAGRKVYEYQKLAELVGVGAKNWSETFTKRWALLRGVFLRLDRESLLAVSCARSEQKAASSHLNLAKLD